MKIVDLRARCVAIPLNCELRGNTGTHPGYFQRTILELFTDEGITGLGEVGGGDQRDALTKMKPKLIGMDPFQLELIKRKTLRSVYYIANTRNYGAIETACLDIQGKALGRPVSDLLGGRTRDRVDMIGYLFWRVNRPRGGDDTRAEDLADHCEELNAKLGIKTVKMKAGQVSPRESVRALELCRERMGDDFGLRIDPNGTWSVATAIEMGRRMEDINVEYLEDPSWGLCGNAAVREKLRIPIATNMFPNKFDDIGPAVTMKAVDIILSDLHYWEGPRGVKELAAICRAFGLGIAMHSGSEFGVELAAMLHTASTIPEMTYAGDAHYHYLTDDIIADGLMKYEDGCVNVPSGPGLGVELDPDKMEKYEKYYQRQGDYYTRFMNA